MKRRAASFINPKYTFDDKSEKVTSGNVVVERLDGIRSALRSWASQGARARPGARNRPFKTGPGTYAPARDPGASAR